jgi:hypothetical protein
LQLLSVRRGCLTFAICDDRVRDGQRDAAELHIFPSDKPVEFLAPVAIEVVPRTLDSWRVEKLHPELRDEGFRVCFASQDKLKLELTLAQR